MMKRTAIAFATAVTLPLLQPILADQAVAASAQARTYVSGSGKDTNPCTATSPCLTLAAALKLTTAGGEIFVLDSANYGPVTINKAVSITSVGASAGVLASSGTAISINAGASDVVSLKGLDLDGGNTTGTGVQFVSGAALIIQNSSFRGFTANGLTFSSAAPGSLYVADSVFSGNAKSGAFINAAGSGQTNAVMVRISATRNGTGILVSGANSSVTITDTIANANTYGIGASSAAVMVRNSTLSNNGVGISADQSAVVQVGQSTVTANKIGWNSTNGGQITSYGNNTVGGNSTDGSASSTLALQ